MKSKQDKIISAHFDQQTEVLTVHTTSKVLRLQGVGQTLFGLFAMSRQMELFYARFIEGRYPLLEREKQDDRNGRVQQVTQ